MKLNVLSPVIHDGKDYAAGDTVDIKDEAQAAALIACGAAEPAPTKRGAKAEEPAAE